MDTADAAAMPGLEALASWPAAERRQPPLSDRHYLSLSTLSSALRASMGRHLAHRAGDCDVLDVGCGVKPYLPFFAPYASTYRGIDSEPGPYVDDVGSAESLPYPDGSFDVVLCTQVLEHVYEPAEVVREVHRVLRPGGVALASTHGVFLYHPDPPGSDRDFWRWTHSGLERLFRTSSPWSHVEVAANGEVVACLAYIACQFVDEAGQRLRRPRLRRLAVSLVNRLGEALDRTYPPRARVPAPGSLSGNYLVTAVKATSA